MTMLPYEVRQMDFKYFISREGTTLLNLEGFKVELAIRIAEEYRRKITSELKEMLVGYIKGVVFWVEIYEYIYDTYNESESELIIEYVQENFRVIAQEGK